MECWLLRRHELRREPYREKKKRQVMDAISFIAISKGFRARNVPAIVAG